jgi:hypothetical protein
MYYSRPFHGQDRGWQNRRGGGPGPQEESISNMLNNFSKAVGK